jgi:hypothetical protein
VWPPVRYLHRNRVQIPVCMFRLLLRRIVRLRRSWRSATRRDLWNFEVRTSADHEHAGELGAAIRRRPSGQPPSSSSTTSMPTRSAGPAIAADLVTSRRARPRVETSPWKRGFTIIAGAGRLGLNRGTSWDASLPVRADLDRVRRTRRASPSGWRNCSGCRGWWPLSPGGPERSGGGA